MLLNARTLAHFVFLTSVPERPGGKEVLPVVGELNTPRIL